MTGTINPSVEQSLKQTFENNFMHVMQQKQSLFRMSPALKNLVAEGNIHNISRMGRVELVETVGRNPTKTYNDPDYDNRKFSLRRYTYSDILDRKDAMEAIKDPTSDIYTKLARAARRTYDRVVAEAATSDILMGETNAAGVTITAVADGVITVDCTAGVTYAKLLEAHRNFINNEVTYTTMEASNLTLAVTGTEWEDLMNEDKFINNDYTIQRPVDKGSLPQVMGIQVLAFAGSSTGITVADPILDESIAVNTQRHCLLMAPEAIGFALRVERFDFVENVQDYVDSSSITVVVVVNAIRLEGKKIQILLTTV